MDGEAAPREKRYWVYILRCADGTLYTGITNDVPRRLAAHNSGRGAKYTRGRGPVELVYREACGEKSAALRREAAVKRLSREEQLRLRRDEADHPAPILVWRTGKKTENRV